jgi:ketosteroid isomerase-like protein
MKRRASGPSNTKGWDMSEEDIARLRQGYEAFAAGDLDTIRGLLDENLVWHVSGRSPLVGDYKGIDEVFGFFAKLAELSSGTIRIELHDVLANGTHSVALTTSTAQRDGKSIHDNGVAVYHTTDGKVTEAWFHPGDAYAVDEFWS